TRRRSGRRRRVAEDELGVADVLTDDVAGHRQAVNTRARDHGVRGHVDAGVEARRVAPPPAALHREVDRVAPGRAPADLAVAKMGGARGGRDAEREGGENEAGERPPTGSVLRAHRPGSSLAAQSSRQVSCPLLAAQSWMTPTRSIPVPASVTVTVTGSENA